MSFKATTITVLPIQIQNKPLFLTHYLQSHFHYHYSQQCFEENWSIFLLAFSITVYVDCVLMGNKLLPLISREIHTL